jgi:hypothetical protein
MNSFVGIFWGIPGPDRSWTILTDTTSLAEAEPYGDFLTHPPGHYDVWSKWQKQSDAELSRQGMPAAILHHEYEDFPRGRIVYHIKTGGFIVYADRRLQLPDVVTRIAGLFGLAQGTFIIRPDAHYRT